MIMASFISLICLITFKSCNSDTTNRLTIAPLHIEIMAIFNVELTFKA